MTEIEKAIAWRHTVIQERLRAIVWRRKEIEKDEAEVVHLFAEISDLRTILEKGGGDDNGVAS